MDVIEQIQHYFHAVAQVQYQALRVPPFTLFFHPDNDATWFNYAIPDRPPEGDLGSVLRELETAFWERGRMPRFEFVEEYAPELAPALRASGFREDARLHVMACTPDRFRPAGDVPGVVVVELDARATSQEIGDYLLAARQGFDPTNLTPPTEHEISTWQSSPGGAFLARVDGQPAGVAAYQLPIAGVTEIVGVATRVPFRGRGIGTLLSSRATAAAFSRGATLACLAAADERAGRVYQRLGFQPCATMLFYLKRER